MEDSQRRPEETLILSLLEQVIHAAEEAQAYVQHETELGELNRDAISLKLMHIRALTIDLDHVLAGDSGG
jgi:hypothetical protein